MDTFTNEMPHPGLCVGPSGVHEFINEPHTVDFEARCVGCGVEYMTYLVGRLAWHSGMKKIGCIDG